MSNETQFGVAQNRAPGEGPIAAAAEMENENQQMFSCGSLAPKLKRGGGCMDHGFARAQEPWELSDGCVYLLKELTLVRCPDDLEIEKNVFKLF